MKSSRLQPWLTVYQVALVLIENGYEVHVLTDCGQETCDGIIFHQVRSLRGPNAHQIIKTIREISPDVIVISVTPLSMMTCTWYRKIENIKKIAFFSYSPYTKKEIIKSLMLLSVKDIFEFAKHLIVPKNIFDKCLNLYFDASICQSLRTFERLHSSILSTTNNTQHVHFIPPGIDKRIWKLKEKKISCKTMFLYTGSLSKIRGFSILIDAFSSIQMKDCKLRVLARGADGNFLKDIVEEIDRRGLGDSVSIRGGWIAIDDLKREIYQADMVVLPFVLVPSELPVTLMEAIACGTPVLVTDIDGLPSAIGEAGLVVPHVDIPGLSRNMEKFHGSLELKQKLNNACLTECNRMESWDSIGKKWIKVIES